MVQIANIFIIFFIALQFMCIFPFTLVIMLLSIIWSIILNENLSKMSMHVFNRWLGKIDCYFTKQMRYNRVKTEKV